MKRLIINADDYGMSAKFNGGILELVKEGIVTSTTVMVNKKFVHPKDLLAFKNISIGLHLELSFESPKKDIEEQIRKFKRMFGKMPSHLDGHKYYHLLPGNFSKVIQIAKKYDLPVRSASSIDRKMLKKSGLNTPDNYISWHPERYEKMLREVKGIKSGITELLCHPGYFDPKASTSYNKQREIEMQILQSKKFGNLLRSFEKITYEQI